MSVSDPTIPKAFYEAVLTPLGYRVIVKFGLVIGLGELTPGAPEDVPIHAGL